MELTNVGQLINHLALKAGIRPDDDSLKNILSNAELSKTTIPSDFAKAMDNNLLSIEVAKDNHPEIASIYKAQALNALDRKLDAIAEEKGFDDESYKSTKNSYKKLDLIVDKLKSEKQPNKPHEGLQKQVDELIQELKTTKESAEAEKKRLESERLQDKRDFILKEKLSARKTIFDDLDADIRYISLTTAINKKLQEHDAELAFDENGNLIPLKKDGTKLLGANHTPIDLQSLIDTTMAQNKFDVSTPPAAQREGVQRTIPAASTHGTTKSVIDYNRKQRETFLANSQ